MGLVLDMAHDIQGLVVSLKLATTALQLQQQRPT